LRIGLILPHMLGLDIVSFTHKHVFVVFLFYFSTLTKKKKNWGRRCRILIFSFFLLIAFQISYVFLLDISVHCVLIEYAYI
jgi:phosphoglycerol transferase MdoB-like AlkP superfamily enzyme